MHRPLALLIPLAGALCLAPAAQALNLSFSTLTDTATAIPGGGGSFTAFPADPAQSFSVTAFTGSGDGGQQGVYLFDPAFPTDPMRPIADTASAIPGGSGTFTGFLAPSVSGDAVVFTGSGSGGQQGVYACDRTTPVDPCRLLADTASLIPGGSGAFTGFLAPGIGGDAAAFTGSGSGGQQWVYACDRTTPVDPCRLLADTLTEIPGGSGTFTTFVPPSPIVPAVSRTLTAFWGAGDGQQGLYAYDSAVNQMQVLADATTAIPAGGGG